MKSINARQKIAKLREYVSDKRVALIGVAALLTIGYPKAGYDSLYTQQEIRTRSAYSEVSQGTDKESDLRKRWDPSSLEDIADEGLRLDVRRLNDKDPLLGLWRVYKLYFEEAATKNDVPVNMGVAIACVESRYNPWARSHVGAKGMMQLMPITLREIGLPREKVFDPRSSINGGAEYYSKLFKKYDDPMLALIAYNWGQGNLDDLLRKNSLSPRNVMWSEIKPRLPKETRKYVPKVLGTAIKIVEISEANHL